MASGVKLSVIVPAFNMSRYLAQCLDSILTQEVNFKYQILIGEDSSTDNTKDIAAQYQEKYPDLINVVYNVKNLGPSGNLCKLIELVETEFFIQIDGDDYITDKNKLQVQFDALNAHPDCAMCFHNYAVVDSEGNNPKVHTYSFSGDFILPEDYLLHHDLGPGNLVMIRRASLPKVLPSWIHHCGYQVDYLVHCLAVAEGRVYYIDKVMTAYRKHAQSITTVTKKKYILEMMINNPASLAGFYKTKGLKKESSFFKSLLPNRYMTLGYFYLSENKILYFLYYFFKGFVRHPNFNLKQHKDMVYNASPELAQKLKKYIH